MLVTILTSPAGWMTSWSLLGTSSRSSDLRRKMWPVRGKPEPIDGGGVSPQAYGFLRPKLSDVNASLPEWSSVLFVGTKCIHPGDKLYQLSLSIQSGIRSGVSCLMVQMSNSAFRLLDSG